MSLLKSFILLKTIFISIFIFLFIQTLSAQTASTTAADSGFQFNGSTQITSHFIYRGLSYTDKDPGLNTNMNFNFGPQFKLGLFGSNVKFSDTHLWIALDATVMVQFSADVGLNIYFKQNQFFKIKDRNYNSFGAQLTLYDFLILYENLSNWEGTKTSATYYQLAYKYDLGSNFKFEPALGYTIQKANLKNYFDLRLPVNYESNHSAIYGAFITLTSSPGQFSDKRGQMGFGATLSFAY